jgi:serine/threonine protein kinase
VVARLPEALPGTLVDGRYTLTDQVGRGGFGVVFRAEDLYGPPCALKLIPFSHWTERSLAQREAARLEEHAHPGLVAFHGTGRFGPTSRGFVYIAMELGEGSLHEHVHRAGPIALGELRALVLDVLDALDHLHARGVVHGDVKPGNLVRAGGRWKLCDLGSATVTGGPSCRDGRWSGTPEAMAPEAFDGEVGPPADLWSVGLLVHEGATRRTAFPVRGAGAEAIERMVKETAPAIDPSLAEPFASIVRGCLERDPARRFTSAQVREALAYVPQQAPPDRPHPARRWVGAALVWGAALAALAWEIARG